MNITHTTDTTSYGLPTPLLDGDGGGDAYPNDETEVGG